MSDNFKTPGLGKLETKPQDLEALAAKAAGHPMKGEGDVCIGKLPTRGGELLVWSAEDSKGFCRIAGQSAKKLGYLPWQEVQAFLRERLEPLDRRTPSQEFSSNLQVGEGPPALQEDASTVPGHETRGKVVELREIRPRAFFWETLREIAAPGLRSRQK